MQLSTTAKTIAINHYLVVFPGTHEEIYNHIDGDEDILNDCEISEVYDGYTFNQIAEWIVNLAITVQEAMDSVKENL